jgi:mRNA-degrading endonuclease toxin of MazEF toxin-antitoxin module
LTPDTLPRRGEIWTAEVGEPPVRRHVLVVSLNARGASENSDSVLVAPLTSAGHEGPTVFKISAADSGLQEARYVKGHLVQVFPKKRLLSREGKALSQTKMREVTLAIRRAFDPEAPWVERGK